MAPPSRLNNTSDQSDKTFQSGVILFIAVFGAMVPTAATELELPREVGPEPVLEPGVHAAEVLRQQDQQQPLQAEARHGVRVGRVRKKAD